jgi:hypothetical protein
MGGILAKCARQDKNERREEMGLVKQDLDFRSMARPRSDIL